MTDLFASIVPVEGASLKPGKAYHDIPGVDAPAYRTTSQQRAEHIATYIDVKGKRGLDIGCSVGGVSKALTDMGAQMTGVDWDPAAIAVAGRFLESVHVLNLATEWQALTDLLWARDFDFAIWLSQWMWLAKQAGERAARVRLRQISQLVPVLVFETADTDETSMAGAGGVVTVEGLLTRNTECRSVVNIGGCDDWQGGRDVFVCTRPQPSVKGAVTQGYGAASHDVAKGRYHKYTGELYPGTLNLTDLRPGPPFREWNEYGPKALGPPHTEVKKSGIKRRLWPVSITGHNRTVSGWAMVPRASHGTSAFGSSIELLSVWELRKTLHLGDGDTVEITRR